MDGSYELSFLSTNKQNHLADKVFQFSENDFGAWDGHCFPTVSVETQAQIH